MSFEDAFWVNWSNDGGTSEVDRLRRQASACERLSEAHRVQSETAKATAVGLRLRASMIEQLEAEAASAMSDEVEKLLQIEVAVEDQDVDGRDSITIAAASLDEHIERRGGGSLLRGQGFQRFEIRQHLWCFAHGDSCDDSNCPGRPC